MSATRSCCCRSTRWTRRSPGCNRTLAQAQTDLTRAETLFRQGAGPRTTLDQARTAVEVATAALRSRTAERAVAQQNLAEGQVLAPVAGRVLTVPLTKGTVVLNGDTIATVGEQPFLLRLRIPERHAVFLQTGRCRPPRRRTSSASSKAPAADHADLSADRGRPRGGRRARSPDLGNYFVGDRVLVWIDAGTRQGFVVPASFVETRFGLDYVKLRAPGRQP